MPTLTAVGLAVGLTLFAVPTIRATDYWDLATNNDNGTQTDNQLIHGIEQLHDLEANAGPVPDQDWYGVIGYFRSSYEAVIDSMSGDLDMFAPPENFQRLDTDGTTVLQTSEQATPGTILGFVNRALRWEVGGSSENQFLRVQSAACGATCGGEDRYRITFYETTISVPRFNNAGSQTTVLIIQNAANLDRPLNGTAYFWTTDGTLFALQTFSLFPTRTALVLNTAPIAPGIGGTITIAHDGGYGGLAVKAVALEPATGFSFDSPGVYKPK
jgi:hypothetical protein